MKATLKGIKKVDYVKKDTKEHKSGLELHLQRVPYPTESFISGSTVCFTEYVGITSDNKSYIDRILSFPIGSELNLTYIQNGRFSSLVEVSLYK